MTIINLMQAYELDKLSKLEFTDEEILRTLQTGDVSVWQEKVPNYEFSKQWHFTKKGSKFS